MTNLMIELQNDRTRVRTRHHSRGIVKGLKCALALSSMFLATGKSLAQTPECAGMCALYSELLMSPERKLVGSIRSIERVANPPIGPRNTRGRWTQREVYLGSASFTATFYVSNGLIQRIELVSAASDVDCRKKVPWASAIAAVEAWQPKGSVTGNIETQNRIQQSIHWAIKNMDVSIYLSDTAETCSTKVAFKYREVKDASEL